jgi:uncharacterized protein (TIGR01732 family)
MIFVQSTIVLRKYIYKVELFFLRIFQEVVKNMGCGYGYDGGYGGGSNFALIVVLFILLIIVGTSFMSSY